MEPAHDPSWGLYPETVLQLHLTDGALRIDLRVLLTPELASKLRKLGPSTTFAVVTSDNPFGRDRDAGENRSYRAELARQLRGLGAFHVSAAGSSPDEGHSEQGYAVWLDLEDARRLAQAYGQSAFFWFDGSEFRIEGALVQAPPRRLPLNAA